MKFEAKCLSVDFEENTITFLLPDNFWNDKKVRGGDLISEIDSPNILPQVK
jgi:hypothetical protein